MGSGRFKEIHAELIEAARLIILGLWTVDPVFSLGIRDKLAEFTNELGALDADGAGDTSA